VHSLEVMAKIGRGATRLLRVKENGLSSFGGIDEALAAKGGSEALEELLIRLTEAVIDVISYAMLVL
jgi:hypothetical protein